MLSCLWHKGWPKNAHGCIGKRTLLHKKGAKGSRDSKSSRDSKDSKGLKG